LLQLLKTATSRRRITSGAACSGLVFARWVVDGREIPPPPLLVACVEIQRDGADIDDTERERGGIRSKVAVEP
jgi:hypothetical protein